VPIGLCDGENIGRRWPAVRPRRPPRLGDGTRRQFKVLQKSA